MSIPGQCDCFRQAQKAKGSAVCVGVENKSRCFFAKDKCSACNNRWSSRGYPLSEGSLDHQCVLPVTGTTGSSTSGAATTFIAAIRYGFTRSRSGMAISGSTSFRPTAGPAATIHLESLRAAFDEHDYERLPGRPDAGDWLTAIGRYRQASDCLDLRSLRVRLDACLRGRRRLVAALRRVRGGCGTQAHLRAGGDWAPIDDSLREEQYPFPEAGSRAYEEQALPERHRGAGRGWRHRDDSWCVVGRVRIRRSGARSDPRGPWSTTTTSVIP